MNVLSCSHSIRLTHHTHSATTITLLVIEETLTKRQLNKSGLSRPLASVLLIWLVICSQIINKASLWVYLNGQIAILHQIMWSFYNWVVHCTVVKILTSYYHTSANAAQCYYGEIATNPALYLYGTLSSFLHQNSAAQRLFSDTFPPFPLL